MKRVDAARLERRDLFFRQRFGVDSRLADSADEHVALVAEMARAHEHDRVGVEFLQRIDRILGEKRSVAISGDSGAVVVAGIDDRDCNEFVGARRFAGPVVLLEI